MPSFRHLKEGDKVMRCHGNGPWMEMHIVRVRDNTLIAAPNMPTRELTDDPELQWGKTFGQTGSYLKEI